MKLSFSKYHGAGNDFILIDDRALFFPDKNDQLIRKLCERRYGIGADGLILVQKSTCADLKMRIFNADGHETEMCGNGLRCLIHFTQSIGTTRVETMHSVLTCSFDGENITVDMPLSSFQELEDAQYLLNTGVPHLILFTSDLKTLDVKNKGRELRNLHNANVNFIQISEDQTVHIRTYERGVEDETHACGTAAAAAALVAAKKHGLPNPLKIMPLSREPLHATVHPSHIQISAPAHFIFRGVMDILA